MLAGGREGVRDKKVRDRPGWSELAGLRVSIRIDTVVGREDGPIGLAPMVKPVGQPVSAPATRDPIQFTWMVK